MMKSLKYLRNILKNEENNMNNFWIGFLIAIGIMQVFNFILTLIVDPDSTPNKFSRVSIIFNTGIFQFIGFIILKPISYFFNKRKNL